MEMVHEVFEDRQIKGWVLEKHIFTYRYGEGTCIDKIDTEFRVDHLRGHNWVFSPHGPQCTVSLNSNFAILKT